MARIIAAHPGSQLVSRGDLFTTLARAIVGQQISVKAAASVWGRLQALVKPFQATTLHQLGSDQFEGVGLSKRKIEYLGDLARAFTEQPDLAQTLQHLEDELVIARLTEIRGVGRWTAEMALIFALMRTDVLPLADLGLMKAISLRYYDGLPISLAQAKATASIWSPWRSVATWYCWRSLDPEPVDY
jgi:DNA-3-methyladenine glycosylase II